MEVISNVLAQYGMTGIFILVLIFAVRKIYNQFSGLIEKKEKESNDLEREFRMYLMETKSDYLQIIKENTALMKEFSKSIIEFNIINRQVLNKSNKK